jgi:hypothetical protein
VNEDFSDLIANATTATVTVRAADGHPLVQTKALHAAAVGAAAIMLVPRLAAAAAIGALLAGVTMTVDTPAAEATEGGAG